MTLNGIQITTVSLVLLSIITVIIALKKGTVTAQESLPYVLLSIHILIFYYALDRFHLGQFEAITNATINFWSSVVRLHAFATCFVQLFLNRRIAG